MCKRRSSSKCREVIIRSSPFNSEPNNSFLWVFTSSSLDCAQGKENVNPTGSFLSLIFCFSMKSPRQSATWSKSCRQKENRINQSVFLCVAPVHRAGPDVTPPLYLMDLKETLCCRATNKKHMKSFWIKSQNITLWFYCTIFKYLTIKIQRWVKDRRIKCLILISLISW